MQPFLFTDASEMYLLWHKATRLKFTFQVASDCIQTEVTIEAPSRDAIKGVSASILDGLIEPLVRKMAISLPKKIWADSAKRIDTTTFTGLRARIMENQNEVVTL